MKKKLVFITVVLLIVSVVSVFAKPTPKENADYITDTVIGLGLGAIKKIGGRLSLAFAAADFVVYAATGKTIGGYANDGFERSSKTIYADDNRPSRGWMNLGMQ